MRQGWLWAVSIAAVVSVSACGGEPAAVAPPTDVLVLEVGGAKPSLRASLVALGRSVAPGYELRPRSLPVGPAVDRNIPGTRDPGFTPVPTPKPSGPVDGPVEPVEPDPVVPAESEWVIVRLELGETPIHLAQRYLGNGRRFREVMAWNGWSEQDSRRLKLDQPVKIKRSEMR